MKEKIALTLALISVIGLGWGAREYLETSYARREVMLVAGAQLQYIMARQEAALVREIAALERTQERRKLTDAEKYRLQSLREELKETREVRKGK